MRKLLFLALALGWTLPALADQIDRCGTYSMEGRMKIEPAARGRAEQLALVLEPGTRSETVVLLGDYDAQTHEDLIGTKARAEVYIVNFCRYLCLGELRGDVVVLEPDHELAQFFYPWPEPLKEETCALDAPIPEAEVLLVDPSSKEDAEPDNAE